ncbi:MAG: hypothetical protein QM775_01975 [Pirellulales bacterium]
MPTSDKRRIESIADALIDPGSSVVVIARDAERPEPGGLQTFDYAADVVDLLLAVARHPIAGHHDDVGLQIVDAGQHAAQVVVVDKRANVQIAELHECFAVERRRQPDDRNLAPHHLDPMRLDPPSVEQRRRRRTETAEQGAAKKLATGLRL